MPNPYLLLGLGLAFAIACGGAYYTGRVHEGNARDAAQLVAERAAEDLNDEQEGAAGGITAEVGAETETRRASIREITNTLMAEVPHVIPQADRNLTVPAGLGRLWLDSIRGELSSLPGTPGEPHGLSPAPEYALALSAIVTTDIGNNGKHHECRETLIGLQEWVRRQEALWKEYAAERAGNK